MSHQLVDWAVLYVPLVVAIVLLCSCRIYPRLKVAIYFSTLWQVASLPWLNAIANHLNCWQFAKSSLFVTSPLHYYLGWVILWGVIATVALGKLPSRYARWWVLLAAILFDVVCMPLLSPTLTLSPHWLAGELLLLLFGLVPSLWLAHWTLSWTKVCWRSFFISVAFGVAILTLSPFMAGHSYQDFVFFIKEHSKVYHLVYIGGFILLFTPAVAAIIAFAKLGKGTPIPFDPPIRMVTAGVYSYIGNPIQTAIFTSLVLWGFYLQLPVMWLLATVSLAYCLGIAKWSEQDDMKKRYGKEWELYRSQIPFWRFRIQAKLMHSKPAIIYLALDCGPCSEIAQWLKKKQMIGLEIRDANTWDGELPLERVTYLHPTGEIEQGVAAISSALQHIHLGWAYIGWLMQFPGIRHLLQFSMDASGGSRKSPKEV